MLVLKPCNAQDAAKEYEFVRAIPEDENGFTNAWHGVTYKDFIEKALPQMLDWSEGKNLPDGFVPETFLFLWEDKEIVGQFRIRHYLCESLRVGGGHIGYYIDQKHRGKGYATEGLRLTLEYARNIVPEEEFFLRLLKSNLASLRVMQKNGGRVAGQDETHWFVRIPNPGKTE